ncbi:penicillin-binding protein 2 [bacterium CG_4_9_14_3_um_filter_65_15]|nr:MAG: penicillin-binding protein 2 [bacterium CG_4_9_14_3_um_filter_65_15]
MPGGDREFRRQMFQAVVVLLFLVLAGDLFWMTGPGNRHYRDLALENRQVRFRVTAPRGQILDRSGILLADNTFIADITLSRRDFVAGRCDSTLARMGRWCGLDTALVGSRLREGMAEGLGRLVLVGNADMAQVVAVEERRRDLPGVLVETRPRRRYLEGELFSHLIGYVGQIRDEELTDADPGIGYRSGDMVGRQGIERAFEPRLRGRAGIKLEEVNAAGHRVGRKPVWLEEVQPGGDVCLTLDVRLQRAMSDALGGRVGCGVVLSCRTGEILAACSSPTFDPNLMTVPISREDWQQLSGDLRKPFFNRVLQATYPPGSLYKPIVSLAGLKAQVVGRDTWLEPCLGGWQLGNRFFRCWKPSGHGAIDHRGAMVHSCDTFFYQLGLKLDIDTLAAAARSFGLGHTMSGIFVEEAAGLIPDHQWYDEHYGKGRWSRGVLLNNAIGQGEVLVTPLQMAVVTGRLAVGRDLPSPTFVAGQEKAVTLPALDFASADLAWMRTALHDVVTEGTGHAADLGDVTVAGKTGTAQNSHGEDHAWFMCFAPVEAPEIALAIIMENAGHGGSEAAPVARAWLEAYFYGPARADILAPRDRDREGAS